MKLIRFLLLGVAAFAVLMAIAIGIAFTSRFQTWVAKKALATQPDMHASVGRVSVGMGSVSLQDLRLTYRGAVLKLPSLDMKLSLLKAAGKTLNIESLVARGWSLDLTRAKLAGKAFPKPVSRDASSFGLLPSAHAAPAPEGQNPAFTGVFPMLGLPVDLSLDSADLQGEILAPGPSGQAPARIKATLNGGHLKAGQTGKFDIAFVSTTAGDMPIDRLQLKGTVALTMETPRSFTAFSLNCDAEAKGKQMPQGTHLRVDAGISREGENESYTLRLVGQERSLLSLQARFTKAAANVEGEWKLDLKDSDLSPFALGMTLPQFAAGGEGRVTSDLGGLDQVLDGRLGASCQKFDAIDPRLAAMGALSLKAEFDLRRHGDLLRLTRLKAQVDGVKPVLTLQALQGFEFDIGTRALKVADPSKELARFELLGVPAGWAQGFLETSSLSGGLLQGSLVLKAHEGGFALRSEQPLKLAGLSISSDGLPMAKDIDLLLQFGGDYTPQGWQAQIGELSVKQAERRLLSLSARAGQLASGPDTALKIQGQWQADLPALLSQPAFAAFTSSLTQGTAKGEFSGSLAARKEFHASLDIVNLVAPALQADPLPATKLVLRADMAADGTLSFQAPIQVTNDAKKRTSDLGITGTLKPGKRARILDVKVTSQYIAVEDMKVLAAPFAAVENLEPRKPEKPSITPRPGRKVPELPEAVPFWKGIEGTVTLLLKQVQLNDQFSASDINGTVRIEEGSLRMEELKAGFDSGGALSGDASITFAPSSEPYSMKADLTVVDLDSKGLMSGTSMISPAVEGKFNVSGKLAGTGKNVADMAGHSTGRFNVISKGGTFRLLRTDISDLLSQKSSSGLGGLVAAGLGGLLGKSSSSGANDSSKLDDAMRMAQEIAEYCAGIPFDQLSVLVTRDPQLDFHLQDFTLISPMIRLSGTGGIRHVAEKSILNQPLDLRLQMATRGKMAEHLGKAGLLDGRPDNLGYIGLNSPIRIGGTLAKSDTSEFKGILKKVILGKAKDALLDRLLGR